MTKLPALVKRFLADHRTALRESGKSVLIVALAISALVLAYHVGLFSGLTGLGGVLGESVRQEDIAGAAYVSAASPFTVVVPPEGSVIGTALLPGSRLFTCARVVSMLPTTRATRTFCAASFKLKTTFIVRVAVTSSVVL